jgi:hypothetical protein
VHGCDSAVIAGATCKGLTLMVAAIRIFSISSSAYSRIPAAIGPSGLRTKSTAPSSSACSVTSAPRSVSEDTITTGIGRSRMRLRKKVSPSMRGISTSSVSTSGFSSLMRSRAT